ncbi:sigma-70 family RNA polymerase sigma factor [bacterium]|nr:MAG: sigma-70 family RNA polymerase sigma factor [bacterium]
MTREQNPMSPQDEARFNELMSESYRKVYNMAYRLAGNRTDAEDLTQEAFYRAYRSYSDYEGDRPFENWIFRIVTRLFLDLLRNRRRRVRAVSYDNPIGVAGGGDDNLYFDMPDHSPNPEQQMLEGTFSEDLQRAMNSLSPEQRLLVTLADIEGVPYKDIAEMLDKPVGTIRSRLHRTHKLIRSRLEQIRREGQAATPTKRTFRPVCPTSRRCPCRARLRCPPR